MINICLEFITIIINNIIIVWLSLKQLVLDWLSGCWGLFKYILHQLSIPSKSLWKVPNNNSVYVQVFLISGKNQSNKDKYFCTLILHELAHRWGFLARIRQLGVLPLWMCWIISFQVGTSADDNQHLIDIQGKCNNCTFKADVLTFLKLFSWLLHLTAAVFYDMWQNNWKE